MPNFLTSIFGSRNLRLLKQYSQQVNKANSFEAAIKELSDDAIIAKTDKFRQRLKDGESLDMILPEAFAVVREASVRTLGLRHFDVQLIGGIALHEGKIAEMRTGEGKTLGATLPAYLNSLTGKSVHIVTVNEYLAQRDADWMRPIYNFLGLEVSVIKSGQTPDEKRDAYAADITYGTNNEFGFDYLRDNIAEHIDLKAQRDLTFAIVDEVDSILIDEARTPLIISGPAEESSEMYQKINALIPLLKHQRSETPADQKGSSDIPVEETDAESDASDNMYEFGDFTTDEKNRQAHLTEDGHQKVEGLFVKHGLIGEGESLYDAGNIRLMHHLTAAIRAHALYHRDVEYIVNDGEIVIVDEFTGRTMPGRRWSDGLHQAVEAKEGVRIKEENQTIASITFQNYFRMYDKLSGMTGTADTEAFEFQQIYGLEVVVIPTDKPMVRDDAADLVYLTQKDKFEAIIEDIEDCQKRKQPVLVGTTSIEASEYLSSLLGKQNIKHEVLNAKQHAREADIVIEAGRPGRVTIATNMAGRGTDIVLGGNVEAEIKKMNGVDEATAENLRAEWKKHHEAVVEAGGLHIIGTERHESRRIDNQLRGRSGRQGDPGASRFYLSLEDNLMRIFGDPKRTKSLMSRVGMKDGEAIESRMLSRQIERAQRKVESHNFDIRKQLLKFDNVANDQRTVIYHQRNELMKADEMEEDITAIRADVLDDVIEDHMPTGAVEEMWDIAGLEQALDSKFQLRLPLQKMLDDDDKFEIEKLRERVIEQAQKDYDDKVEQIGADTMRQFEKLVMLKQLDMHWREHIGALDYLRQGIHLRGYAQKNPEQEYKREAFDMFGAMLDEVKHDAISILSRIQVRSEDDVEAYERRRRAASKMKFEHAAPGQQAAGHADGGAQASGEQQQPFVRQDRKVGRNEPCPCGSGKKFKHCHGQLK